MAKRVLFYYHYFDSLGHRQRTLIQAKAIKRRNPNFDVMVVSGGKPIKDFNYPKDIEYVQLPSLVSKKHLFLGLKSGTLSLSLSKITELRKNILISILKYYRPHIVITDYFPFGRKATSNEFLSMVKYAKSKLNNCAIISSTREIIGMPKKDWNNDKKHMAIQRIKKYYNYIFIHGDPKVYKLNEELFLEEVQEKIIYTGYLTCKRKNQLIPKEKIRKNHSAGNKFLVVASVGAGKDGYRLLKNVILAERLLNKKKVLHKFLIFTGPFMDTINYSKLMRLTKKSKDISIERFNPELIDYINASDISISMGGYNTCAELLLTNTRSIIVPRVFEKEQLIRSNMLNILNVTNVIHPRNLTPQLLASEITRIINTPRPKHNINLNGAEYVARFVREI